MRRRRITHIFATQARRINQGETPRHQLNGDVPLIPAAVFLSFFFLDTTRSLPSAHGPEAAACLGCERALAPFKGIEFSPQKKKGSLAFNPAKDPVDVRLLSVRLQFFFSLLP